MDWKYLLTGIVSLMGAGALYNARNWGHYEGKFADGINNMRLFRIWMFIFMGLIIGILCIIKAF